MSLSSYLVIAFCSDCSYALLREIHVSAYTVTVKMATADKIRFGHIGKLKPFPVIAITPARAVRSILLVHEKIRHRFSRLYLFD
jgi:hypothetical protein